MVLQRLKYDAKHNNIIVFAMLWPYSWYLQRLDYDETHNNIVVFAMLWRYSWYIQRLKLRERTLALLTPLSLFARLWLGNGVHEPYLCELLSAS